MKTLRIGLLIILLGVIALFLLRRVPTSSPNRETKSSPAIHTTTAKITDASAAIKYKIDVSYPQFSGMSNKNVQTSINDAIKKQMNNNVNQFKSEVNTTEENIGYLPSEIQNFINEYIITYKVTKVNENIVSVNFAIMDAQAGAAHPSNANQVFNYDVKKKQQIALTDVFKPNTDYLKTLSELSKQQLQSRFKSDPYASDLIAEGTKPEIENFTLFNLSENELVLIFNPATVAADYAGTQTVHIPFSSLRDIINPVYAD